MSKKGRVLVAMSGGVDSCIAAMLMHEQGYEVIGVTMKTWEYGSSVANARETGCCSIDSINDARAMAVKMGFPHYVLDLRDQFEKKVVSNFIQEYLHGRTPNPCVMCNRDVKWGDLLIKADELDCEFLVTGHYATVVSANDRYFLRRGIDSDKDQTYVLWNLAQDQLARTIFPLGGLKKQEVKEMAIKFGLPHLASKSESYEICFIPDNDYRGFLKKRVPGLGEKLAGGPMVDKDGNKLGSHQGYPFYTIGQRKGLEVAVGYPLYVKKIIPETNTIVMGKRDEVFSNEMLVDNVNYMKYADFKLIEEARTHIRYKDIGTFSAFLKKEDGTIKVLFNKEVAAITPGQSAVFYEGEDLIGGGLILS